MSGRCDCRYCTASSPAAVVEPAEPARIELPAEPTPIRVHTADSPPFDCVLHPDGTQTAVINGQQLQNMLTLADMLDMNSAGARIEFNPPPLDAEQPPVAVPGPVQDAIPMSLP